MGVVEQVELGMTLAVLLVNRDCLVEGDKARVGALVNCLEPLISAEVVRNQVGEKVASRVDPSMDE